MTSKCPKCGAEFGGYSIGAHATLCGVSQAMLFWSHVDKSGGRKACWPWTKAGHRDGYGRVNFRKRGKMQIRIAHRIAWELANDRDVPRGMEVGHRCDMRLCCNPSHLWLCTHSENMADCKAKDRQARGERTKRNKLVARDVLAIRRNFVRFHPNKSNIPALAREYRVSKSCIRDVVLRIRWQHLN